MKLTLYLCAIMMLVSCSNKTNSKTNILSQNQMEKLIWDIMLVDEFTDNHIVKDSSKDANKERLKLYLEVFQLHHTSQQEFSASMKYYSQKPDLMKVIFDSLSARGERERKKLIPH
jgi:hypothetical protein